MSTPYLAIGNDELTEDAADIVRCDRCGGAHRIEFGTSRQSLPGGGWSEPAPSKLLGFVKCGGKLYLASVNGKRFSPSRSEKQPCAK